jgi:phosphoglycolate phosphatase
MNKFVCRLIVFDLDGTLVDSRRDLAESANEVLKSCGCGQHSEEAIGRMVGDGAATLIARAFEAAGCQPPRDALARFLSIYDQRLLRYTRPYDGIRDVLSCVSRASPLAVLTNKPLIATRAILDGLGLTRFFGTRIVGGDGPFPRKPDPRGLLDLVTTAGARAHETLLVGDSFVDFQTARAAQTRVCVARYGFGFEGFPVSELRDSDPRIDRPVDLLHVLSAVPELSSF